MQLGRSGEAFFLCEPAAGEEGYAEGNLAGFSSDEEVSTDLSLLIVSVPSVRACSRRGGLCRGQPGRLLLRRGCEDPGFAAVGLFKSCIFHASLLLEQKAMRRASCLSLPQTRRCVHIVSCSRAISLQQVAAQRSLTRSGGPSLRKAAVREGGCAEGNQVGSYYDKGVKCKQLSAKSFAQV